MAFKMRSSKVRHLFGEEQKKGIMVSDVRLGRATGVLKLLDAQYTACHLQVISSISKATPSFGLWPQLVEADPCLLSRMNFMVSCLLRIRLSVATRHRYWTLTSTPLTSTWLQLALKTAL
jgi:hypothetical protein